jgi:hypothetical protein
MTKKKTAKKRPTAPRKKQVAPKRSDKVRLSLQNKRCGCVGALVSDLGFGDMSREEASALYPVIVRLCELVPELWARCGQGLAAIEAVASS